MMESFRNCRRPMVGSSPISAPWDQEWCAVDGATMRLADTGKLWYDDNRSEDVRTVQIYDGVVVAELQVAIDILDDDDGIIDEHAEREDEAEEDYHVEGVAQRLDNGHAHEHAQGDDQGHDETGVNDRAAYFHRGFKNHCCNGFWISQ